MTYPVRLEVLPFIESFIYIHTICLRAAEALASLCICADSPEASLFDNAIRTKNLVPADMYKMYPCFTELVSVEQCRDCFVLLRVYYCTNYI